MSTTKSHGHVSNVSLLIFLPYSNLSPGFQFQKTWKNYLPYTQTRELWIHSSSHFLFPRYHQICWRQQVSIPQSHPCLSFILSPYFWLPLSLTLTIAISLTGLLRASQALDLLLFNPCPTTATNVIFIDMAKFNLNFLGDLAVKNPPTNAEDTGSVLRSGRSPGEGNGNPLQCSCLENSRNRGCCQTTVHGVAKRWTWTTAFFMVQLSHPYMTTGKTIALTIRTFVNKVMSLLFNMLSRFVIAFLSRSKCLLNLWLQSPSTVILESKNIKSVTASIFFPSICPIYFPSIWPISI